MNFTKVLCEVAKEEGIDFVLSGKPIDKEEVFADTGFLPGLARRADKVCLLCLGYGIGVTFVDADKSRLGVKVQFDDVTPSTLRLIYLYDVVMELVRLASSKSEVSLDELMYD